MKPWLTPTIDVVKRAVGGFIHDRAMMLSAALSFYTMISFAPLLVITLAVAGMLFGERAARGELADQIETYLGRPGAEVVESILANADAPGSGLAAVAGILFLLVSASLVFAQLRNSLNIVWDVELPGGKSGIIKSLLGRLLSMGMVLGIGLMLLVSVLAGAVVNAIRKFAVERVPFVEYAEPLINVLLGVVMAGLFFAILFRFLPATRVSLRGAILGGFITAFLFNAGRFGISLYLGHSSVGSAYGAAGSLLVLLLWIYYSAIIFFFGAELTREIDRSISNIVLDD